MVEVLSGMPRAIQDALENGMNPIAAFREWRGMSVRELALAAGLPTELEAFELDLFGLEDSTLGALVRALRVTDRLTTAAMSGTTATG